MKFVLDKEELEVAAGHMFTDDNGKMFFTATKEHPNESIYLDTEESDAYDDLMKLHDHTDVRSFFSLLFGIQIII